MNILRKREDALTLSKLDIDDVIYRGEGNLSLVVSLKSLGKVIRFPKIIKGQQLDLAIIKEKLLNEIEYSWNVMHKLFMPNLWINRYLLIELSKEQMIKINDKVESSRPDLKKFQDYRKSKLLPCQNYFGLLIEDYCSFQIEQLELVKNKFKECQLTGPVFSIEIKPKQGFISEELNNLGICKFRLRQQEKISLKLVTKSSSYCPLDLFSGDKERMKFALNSLIDNPQNNFRLFIDKQFFDTNENLDENLNQTSLKRLKLIDLLIFVLNHSFNVDEEGCKKIKTADCNQPICKYHYDLHKLSSNKGPNTNSILKSILDVQKLDEIGSTKAYELYNYFKSRYESSFNEWISQSRHSTELTNLSEKKSNEADHLKQELTKFLYSMTAKDCSVLISFQKVLNIPKLEQQNNCKKFDFHTKRICFYTDKTDNSVYLFTLALIDLDRKQPEKVESTFKGDQQKKKLFANYRG